MPDLDFAILGAEAVPYAAAPLLSFKLRVRNSQPDENISAIMLQCQIQIEAPRRQYSPGEQERPNSQARRYANTISCRKHSRQAVSCDP